MEYYSAIKRRHFTLCDSMMDLKNIMLSEISQSKTNTIWFHLYVESNEQTQLTSKIKTDSETESRMTARGVRRWKD